MKCALLDDVPNDDLKVILSLFVRKNVFKGTEFIRKGEPGDELFILSKGRAAVKIGGKTICTLGEGDIIGEVCLTQPGSPRTATLLAETDLVLYGINSTVMEQVGRSYPQTVGVLWRNIARIEGQRLRNVNTRLEETEKELHATKREKNQLETQLAARARTGLGKIKTALVAVRSL